MLFEFIITTSIAGVICGVLGFISFDKILFQKILYASPGRQITYILMVLMAFCTVMTSTILGMLWKNTGWVLVISVAFGICFLFSVPGLMMLLLIYTLIHSGMAGNVVPIIKETATPFLALVAGVAVTMTLSSSEPTGIYALIYQEMYVFIGVLGYLIGGIISAIIAFVTKHILKAIFD